MPTNLAIDDALLRQAQELGGHKTKKDTVEAALDEYVRFRLRCQLIEMFGTVEYDDEHDYRAARKYQASERKSRDS